MMMMIGPIRIHVYETSLTSMIRQARNGTAGMAWRGLESHGRDGNGPDWRGRQGEVWKGTEWQARNGLARTGKAWMGPARIGEEWQDREGDNLPFSTMLYISGNPVFSTSSRCSSISSIISLRSSGERDHASSRLKEPRMCHMRRAINFRNSRCSEFISRRNSLSSSPSVIARSRRRKNLQHRTQFQLPTRAYMLHI